jgi:hypothetical protein
VTAKMTMFRTRSPLPRSRQAGPSIRATPGDRLHQQLAAHLARFNCSRWHGLLSSRSGASRRHRPVGLISSAQQKHLVCATSYQRHSVIPAPLASFAIRPGLRKLWLHRRSQLAESTEYRIREWRQQPASTKLRTSWTAVSTSSATPSSSAGSARAPEARPTESLSWTASATTTATAV